MYMTKELNWASQATIMSKARPPAVVEIVWLAPDTARNPAIPI